MGEEECTDSSLNIHSRLLLSVLHSLESTGGELHESGAAPPFCKPNRQITAAPPQHDSLIQI